jgi:hypothetical protein
MFDIVKSKASIFTAFVLLALAGLLIGCNRSSGTVMPSAKQSDNGAFLITLDPDATGYTRFSMNSGGHALLAWRHGGNGVESLRGINYDPSVGWSDQAVINPGSSSANQIAIDENNDCFAVWEADQSVGTNRYDTTSGWGSSSSIPTVGSGYVSQPVLAAGPQGTAFALWMESEYTSTTMSLWVSSFETGTGWTAAQPIQDIPNIGFGSYTIAVDGSGNALAVWTQYVVYSGIYTLMARRYEAGVGWGPVETLMPDDDAYPPQVAFDAAGNALVVWGDISGSSRRIVSRRYNMSVGWEAIETLIEVPADTDSIDELHLAMNPGGNAVLVWMRAGNSGFDIWADLFSPGDGWTKSPVRISDGTTDSQFPAVAVNSTGNAVVVWRGDHGTKMNIGATRYSPDAGWSAPKVISTDRNKVYADNPGVGMDAQGNALAVWQEYDPQNPILSFWGNRFDKF